MTVIIEREYPDAAQLTIWEAKLVHLDGNARPYFSLTGTRYDTRRSFDRAARGQRVADSHIDGMGALTGAPPALAAVEAVHLADDDGTPCYAEANGYYWMSENDGRGTHARPDDTRTPRQRAADYLRAAEIPADVETRDDLRAWIDTTRREAWRQDARAALLAILGADAGWIVRRDGITKAVHLYEPDALRALHSLQGQSAHHATTYEGWTVEPI